MRNAFLIIFLMVPFLSSYAQANKKDVRTFLELNGNFDVYNDIVEQFAEQLSESKREAFKKDVSVFIDKISKKEVEKYSSAFSQDEVIKLIEFYKSPLGKKLIEKNNELMKASNKEAQQNYSELQGIVMKYMM